MKNMVKICQDKYYPWSETWAISDARNRFCSWVAKKNNLLLIECKKPIKPPYDDKASQDFLSDLYIELRGRRRVLLSFDEFKIRVIAEKEVYRFFRGCKKDSSKYQKDPKHKKKVKQERELTAEVWRKYKQIERDKSKNEKSPSARKYWRKAERGWIRQDAKTKLRKEDWDGLGAHIDRLNRWLWD